MSRLIKWPELKSEPHWLFKNQTREEIDCKDPDGNYIHINSYWTGWTYEGYICSYLTYYFHTDSIEDAKREVQKKLDEKDLMEIERLANRLRILTNEKI